MRYGRTLALCLAAVLLATAAATPSKDEYSHRPRPKTTKTTRTTTTESTTTTTSTTEEPTTSTSTSSTTPSTTSSTTTPSTPMTTTPAPIKPVPPPSKGKWAYSDPSDNKTCIIVQIAVQMNISYINSESNVAHAIFNMPVNTTKVIDGKCGEPLESLTLGWPSATKDLVRNNVTFFFNKNATVYNLTNINFEIVQDAANFPNAKEPNATRAFSHSNTFSVPLKKSFRCSKQQTVVIDSSDATNSTMTIKDMQVQAFHTDKGDTFDSANDCDIADVPDIVPIAVGCALGGLILIVLISYLVGRRRSQASGYQSM